jgi:hypothetical protein
MCEPVIVMPSMVKSYNDYPKIHRMWDSAASALEQAHQLLIFGFSFPLGDRLIREMFRCSVAKGRALKDVSIIDVNPEPVAMTLKSLLPQDLHVTVQTFTVPMDGSVPDWIVRSN